MGSNSNNSNNSMPWWPSLPTVSSTQANYSPPNTYNPQFDSSSPIAKILDSIGQYLKPQQAYTTVNPVNNFIAPQQAAFNQWATQYARPQFDYWTKNPFMRQQANTAASSGSIYTGGARKSLTDSLKKLEMQYNSDLAGKQTAYLQPFQEQYNKMMQNAGNNFNVKI